MRRWPTTDRALDVWRWRDTFGVLGIVAWCGLFVGLAWAMYEDARWLLAIAFAAVAAGAAYLLVGGLIVLTIEWLTARRSAE